MNTLAVAEPLPNPRRSSPRPQSRSIAGMAAADARRDVRGDHDEPLGLLLVPPPQRLEHRQVALRHLRQRSSRSAALVDILVRRVIPWPSLFGTDDARLREEDITNRRRAWTWRFFLKLVLIIGGIIILRLYAIQVATARPGSRPSAGFGDVDGALHEAPHARSTARRRSSIVVPDLLPLLRQLPHLHGPAAADGHLADPRLRARRRRVGRQARPRPRPGRGEGGDPARRHAVAVGRGVRAAPAASASAACSSSARREPARR